MIRSALAFKDTFLCFYFTRFTFLVIGASFPVLPVGIDVVVFNADNQSSVESVEDNVEDNVVDQGHEAGVPCLRCQAKLSRQWWKLNKYSH